MEEFESTLEGTKPPISTICVIYDEKDGRVVHVHEFVGDGTGLFGKDGEEERAKVALESARRHAAAASLRPLHAPSDFRIESEKVYRVDVATRKLVARTPKRPQLRELIERRRKLD